MNGPHLVTGGSGYLASQTIRELLEAVYTVHTAVCNKADTQKLAPLTSLGEHYPGRLAIFEADLLTPGSFKTAMASCVVVHLMASLFLLSENIKDAQKQLIEPALESTRKVLGTLNETVSVLKVVLTSTIAAIICDYADVMSMENKTLSVKYFNTNSFSEYPPYAYSKTLAEKEA